MHGLWWVLWFDYGYPSLKGNGPEAIIQTIVYGMIAFAVYPPLRKWAKRETEHLHAKVDRLTHLHEDLHDKVDALSGGTNGIPPDSGKT